MKKLSVVSLVALLGCFLSAPAAAQERSNASYEREVSFTYSMLRDIGEMGRTGFLVDFGKQLGKARKIQTSAVGEFALNRFSTFDETYTTVNGGIRFGGVANQKVRPFGQMLVGLQHNFGANGINIQPGGGLNIRVGRSVDVKAQVDFPIVRWEGDTYKQFRFSAGLGLPLGR